MSVRVSILMAVYNGEQYLRKAMDSALQQDGVDDVELLCVDDASTDASLQIIDEYAARDSRVRVFRQPTNQGQAVARNLALREARGEYVVMLDADDWLSEDALRRALAVFDAHRETDCVVLRLMMHDQESGVQTPYPLRLPQSVSDMDKYALSGSEAFRLSLDWSIHGLYVVRSGLHKRYPFDTSCRLYSDDNTTRLHYLHSREVRFCEGVYYYRKHESSCTTAISVNRFLYMDANLSMLRTLEEEHVSRDIIQAYDDMRWDVYLGLWRLYYKHKAAFTKVERVDIRMKFARFYPTLHPSNKLRRFGYKWFSSYRLFVAQEWAFMSLRRLLGRD